VVRDPETEKDLWWGPYSPNYVMDDRTFLTNRERAIDYLNTLDRVYVVDAFVNWDPEVGHEFVRRHECVRLSTGARLPAERRTYLSHRLARGGTILRCRTQPGAPVPSPNTRPALHARALCSPHVLQQSRLKVRVVTSRAYHALFMSNMLIKPTEEELKTFGEPGELSAQQPRHHVRDCACVCILALERWRVLCSVRAYSQRQH
jgi:hypothetical protein